MFVCTIILSYMEKINGKIFSVIGYWLIVIGLLSVLVYSRFVNLGWGLPYPMHPDERNMANAVHQLNCKFPISNFQFPNKFQFSINNFQNCFNPHFFAYGQLPLYLGYIITFLLNVDATIGLRIISAIASVISFIVIIKIIKIITKKESPFLTLISSLLIIFSPYAIQFAHFGTTESLLMIFYLIIIYYSLLFVDRKISTLSFVINISMFVGLSMATKVSSLLFLIPPFTVLLFNTISLKTKKSIISSKNSVIFYLYVLMSKIIDVFILGFLSFVVFCIFAPHNLLNFNDFISSINYESDVALGRSLVFYTRQFFDTIPILFQFEEVFSYVFGWPVFILGALGFAGLSWKDKMINFLRFAFLIYFIPSAIIYAKWSRFMAPIFPLITIFAILFILNIKIIKFIKIIIIIIAIVPGIAYLSIYQNPDIRFQASEWIYKNIPNESYVLSETANVVDIPIESESYKVHKVYQVISFNFYDIDESPILQQELADHLAKADYIFVPSRRIFANHPKQAYPILNQYYDDLFSGKLGFEKVAEFESFPKIKFQVASYKFQVNFPDEQAEETWTVFDHPVIRIYKKVKSVL